jgi:O-antigen/teichoic acid export membrane protein
MSESFSREDVKKVAKGTGITLIGGSVGRGIFFLSQVMIARLLGVEAFGLYALGFAAIKMCEIIAKLGLNTGGLRFVSIYRDESASKVKGVLISATGISFVSGIFVGTILYFFSGFAAQEIFHKPDLAETLRLFALSIPFLAGMTVISTLLQGFHTAKYTVYTRDLIQPSAYLFLILIFYHVNLGLKGMIYAFTLSYFIAFITGFLFLRKLFPPFFKIDIKPAYEFKNLILYSVPLLFIGFLNYFISWLGTLMLGFYSTTREVGIYRAASQVPFIMPFFLTAASSLYAPLVAVLYDKGQLQRLANIYKTTTRWITYVTGPIFILILLAPKEIMMIFGKEFTETGSIVLIIVSFGQFINCVAGGAGYNLIMTGRQNIQLLVSMISVLLNVCLNIILIPRYGSIGAAIANSASIAFANITKMILVFIYFKALPFNRHSFRFASFSVISLIVLLFFNVHILSSVKFSFVIKVIEVLFIFSVFFYSTSLETEDHFLLQRIRSRF